jgi:cyanophycinase
VTGLLALVGGGELTPPCEALDRALLEAHGDGTVVVLPTAAAFEHPDRALANAERWFGALGGRAVGLRVLSRPDAMDPAHVEAVRASPFTYLLGGSPMHLRSVLKATPLWEALVAAWTDGGIVAASSAGAMVLTDPMVDPRGGAFTLGLGLVAPVAVVPHAEEWHHDRMRRTLELARDVPVVTLPTAAAVVRSPDGTWRAEGAVEVHRAGAPAGLDVLP